MLHKFHDCAGARTPLSDPDALAESGLMLEQVDDLDAYLFPTSGEQKRG